jgi:integrase
MYPPVMAQLKKITLCWYCRTPRGWRHFPAIIIKEHGVSTAKHGWVIEGGQEVEYGTGRYELRRYEAGRKVYISVETGNPRDAVLALQKAKRAALNAGDAQNSLAVIKKAVGAYIKDCERRGVPEATEQARVTLNEFIPLCNVTYVRGITREMVLDYHQMLRKKGLSERTIHNKHTRVKSFLKFCKVDTSFMPPAPRYEVKLPTIYTPSEIKSIRDAADPYMRLAINMSLQLGLREQELIYSEWSDIDWHHLEFKVQGKASYGFAVKDMEQRAIPIPAELATDLKAWKAGHPKRTLILGTKTAKPNGHLLRTLKRLAKRAGLNCGRCDGCKGQLGECQEWTLHRFRRTYLTTLLRQGIDARTVQAFAGHSELTTTLRYLKPASAREMQAKINAVKWGD